MANLLFAECSFPAAFKTAQVLPLLKKPGLDKEQMSSYQPISNLTTILKVIERLVLDRLRPHLLSSPNLSRLQLAYRRGHSTETALLHVMNTVYALVGLDISAAFDTIDHDVLASRLESQFGVVVAASSWLRSYLRGRASWQTLVSYVPVRLWRTAWFGARPAAVHCLCVSCWQADQVVRRVIPPVRR